MEYHCIVNLVYTIVLFSLVPQLAYATDGPCEFSAIFNFGDSNSDTGGYAAAFGQFPWPNGESFLNAPASRLCDGRLIMDFIGKQINLIICLTCTLSRYTVKYFYVHLENILCELVLPHPLFVFVRLHGVNATF